MKSTLLKQILILIGVLLVSVLQFSCDGGKCEFDYREVTIKNNSNQKIYYQFYWLYPDTSIGEYNPHLHETGAIHPSKSASRGNSLGLCWIELLLKSKKQYVHIFSVDSLSLIPWDTVRKTQRGLLERREFDLNYLDSTDWILTYP